MTQTTITSKFTRVENQRGVALLTVLLLLLILTVLGMAAIAVTGLETRMSNFSSSTEASASAAESCAGAGVNIIVQTLDLGAVPSQYVVGGTGATSPVVPSNAESSSVPPTLTQEIYAQANNNPDTAAANPDIQFTVGNYQVNGDIDRLYVTQQTGSGIQFAGGSGGLGEGGAGSELIYYRIDCQASNIATGTSNRVIVVYSCLKTGDTCQKKSF